MRRLFGLILQISKNFVIIEYGFHFAFRLMKNCANRWQFCSVFMARFLWGYSTKLLTPILAGWQAGGRQTEGRQAGRRKAGRRKAGGRVGIDRHFQLEKCRWRFVRCLSCHLSQVPQPKVPVQFRPYLPIIGVWCTQRWRHGPRPIQPNRCRELPMRRGESDPDPSLLEIQKMILSMIAVGSDMAGNGNLTWLK